MAGCSWLTWVLVVGHLKLMTLMISIVLYRWDLHVFQWMLDHVFETNFKTWESISLNQDIGPVDGDMWHANVHRVSPIFCVDDGLLELAYSVSMFLIFLLYLLDQSKLHLSSVKNADTDSVPAQIFVCRINLNRIIKKSDLQTSDLYKFLIFFNSFHFFFSYFPWGC